MDCDSLTQAIQKGRKANITKDYIPLRYTKPQ
jgi:hypothetical protein